MILEQPTDFRSNRTGLIFVLLATIVATVLKCAWAFNSLGTIDAPLFCSFGKAVFEKGIAQVYRENALFNHPPLTGWIMAGLYATSAGDYYVFSSQLRLICIFADIGVIAAVLWMRRLTEQPPWWALVLFALSPVSLMVSGFHGNIDPLMVLFLFSSALMVVQRRWISCGLLFGLACQLKIVPLLLLPLWLCVASTHSRVSVIRFSVAMISVMLLVSAIPLIEAPSAYLHRVFGYSGYWGTWGITFLLQKSGLAQFARIGFKDLTDAQQSVIFCLKLLMVAAIVSIALRRRQWIGNAFLTSVTAAFVSVFVFAAGMAPQYLVWLAPFLVSSAPHWYVVITSFSALYIFAVYQAAADSSFPWNFAVPKDAQIPLVAPWMILLWVSFVALLLLNWKRWWKATDHHNESGS